MDEQLRKIERQLSQHPDDVLLRQQWLRLKIRTGDMHSMKTFYKIRCGNKWFSSGGYQPPRFLATGTRFKTEAEAMKRLVQFTQNQRKISRRGRLENPQFAETSVDIICFEVHTIEASAKTVDLVDAAKQAELAEIRLQQKQIAKQAQALADKERALLKEANTDLKTKLKGFRKK